MVCMGYGQQDDVGLYQEQGKRQAPHNAYQLAVAFSEGHYLQRT